jgi:allophanate hydrolase
MDQFATGLVGTRSPYGACASVFHPDYVAGGSSSGSALAVAKGQVCFALGTDTAGSGRVPAAFNGIVGVKPSRGLISMAGVVPACKSLDCLSVFAPDLETGRRVFDAIRGPDQADPYSRTGELQPWTGESPVLGVPKLGSAGFFGDGLAANCWNEAIAKAKRLGAELIEIELEPFQEAAALLYSGPFVAERYAAVGTFVETEPEASVDPTVRQIILDAARYSAADAHRAMYRLEDLKRQCSAILSRMDALLLPTTPTHYRIAEVQNDPILLNARLGTYTNFVNLLDLCGIALPAGMRADGLPFGVTILGPAFADWKMFGLAHWWQETEDSSVQRSEPAEEMVQIAVVGAHLTGQPLNWQLTNRGGTLVRTTRTASLYRLYALTGTTPRKPGLIRVQDPQEQGIEVEVWQLSPQEFGSFVAEIPPPLGIGTLELEDRTQVKGFLCEPYALDDAEEITHLGGWRNYLSQLTPAHASA